MSGGWWVGRRELRPDLSWPQLAAPSPSPNSFSEFFALAMRYPRFRRLTGGRFAHIASSARRRSGGHSSVDADGSAAARARAAGAWLVRSFPQYSFWLLFLALCGRQRLAA